MPELTLCQNCSSIDFNFIQSCYVYLNSVELNLVKCVRCGLIYLNPKPVEAEIAKLYTQEYFLKWYSTEKKRGFSKKFFRELLDQNGLIGKKGDKLLDLGCGIGFFLEVAHERGWDVNGVEISPYAARYCKENLNFDVHCGNLETANYQKESFDIITAFDFLEHVSGLASYLSIVKRFLKIEGRFLIIVPNYDNLLFQLDRRLCKLKKIPLPNVPEHITYFTISTLKTLLQNRGFKVEKILTIDANDDGEYLSLKGAPPGILRTMLNNVCNTLGRMHNRKEAIFAIAKK